MESKKVQKVTKLPASSGIKLPALNSLPSIIIILVEKRQYYRLSQSFLGQLIAQKNVLSSQA